MQSFQNKTAAALGLAMLTFAGGERLKAHDVATGPGSNQPTAGRVNTVPAVQPSDFPSPQGMSVSMQSMPVGYMSVTAPVQVKQGSGVATQELKPGAANAVDVQVPRAHNQDPLLHFVHDVGDVLKASGRGVNKVGQFGVNQILNAASVITGGKPIDVSQLPTGDRQQISTSLASKEGQLTSAHQSQDTGPGMGVAALALAGLMALGVGAVAHTTQTIAQAEHELRIAERQANRASRNLR